MQGKICKICIESRFREVEESFIGYFDRMVIATVVGACRRPALSEEPMQTFVILQTGAERTVFAVRKMGSQNRGSLIFTPSFPHWSVGTAIGGKASPPAKNSAYRPPRQKIRCRLFRLWPARPGMESRQGVCGWRGQFKRRGHFPCDLLRGLTPGCSGFCRFFSRICK